MLVCSMKASSSQSLTAACIVFIFYFTHYTFASHHFCRRLPLRPSNPLLYKMAKSPLCVMAERAKRHGESWEERQKQRTLSGRRGVESVSPPLVRPVQSSGWWPSFFFCSPSPASPGISASLLSLDETFLFVTPELDLCVAGLTALVAELHGGPVVVGATLETTDGSFYTRTSVLEEVIRSFTEVKGAVWPINLTLHKYKAVGSVVYAVTGMLSVFLI